MFLGKGSKNPVIYPYYSHLVCTLYPLWYVYFSHLGMIRYTKKFYLWILLDAAKSKFNMCHIWDSILAPSRRDAKMFRRDAKMFQFLNLILPLHKQRAFDVRIPRTSPWSGGLNTFAKTRISGVSSSLAWSWNSKTPPLVHWVWAWIHFPLQKRQHDKVLENSESFPMDCTIG